MLLYFIHIVSVYITNNLKKKKKNVKTFGRYLVVSYIMLIVYTFLTSAYNICLQFLSFDVLLLCMLVNRVSIVINSFWGKGAGLVLVVKHNVHLMVS